MGFCNHAIGLMYLMSHYSMASMKTVPDDATCTSVPQLWHKPRGKKINSEPLMDMVFKKPRLDVSTAQETGVSCSVYQALRAPPSQSDVDEFKTSLDQINPKYGLSLYMSTGAEMRPTKVGPAPLGGFLSYQLAPTEGNFCVMHNLDFSKEPINTAISIYPSFPLSLVPPLFTVTMCAPDQQNFYNSLMVTYEETTMLEKETIAQRN